MPPRPTPDAIVFPQGRIKEGSATDKLNKIRKVFGPILGCQRVWTSQQGGFNFTTPAVSADGTSSQPGTLLFPIGHPLERTERYDWYVATQDQQTGAWSVAETPLIGHDARAEDVKFGYLKPDPYASGPTADSELADLLADPTAPVASSPPALPPAPADSDISPPSDALPSFV